jgi:site-specific recombinase XerD
VKKTIARFVADLEAGRGFSPRTAEAYRRDLDSWTEFLSRRLTGKLPRPEALTPGHVTLYLADLTKTGRSARTVARHLAAIKSFSRYLRRHGIESTFAGEVRGPRLPKPVPSFLTEAEMEKLFRVDTGDGPNARRDRAILEILYATGIRLAELVGMNRDETLEIDRRQVRVMGKGGRERIVPFGAPAARALGSYIDETAAEPHADSQGLPLFLGRNGARISRRTVQRLIEQRLSSVATRAGLSPHLLRHTMATHLLARMSRGEAAGRKSSDGRGAADIRAVQELLGHVSLASTQVYTHVTVDRLRAALRNAHPRGEE